jgi:hypothetical protein
MDLGKILQELRRELDYLDAAISSLERLQQKTTRRGRPSKVLNELTRHGSSLRRAVEQRRASGGQGRP